MDEGRLARIENKVDSIDNKLDSIAERLPTFVTWGKLGGALATLAGLAIALMNLT